MCWGERLLFDGLSMANLSLAQLSWQIWELLFLPSLQPDMLVFWSLIDNHEEGDGVGSRGAHNRCLSVNEVSRSGQGGLFLYLAVALWLASWPEQQANMIFSKSWWWHWYTVGKIRRYSHVLFNHTQSYIPSFQWYLHMHDTLV